MGLFSRGIEVEELSKSFVMNCNNILWKSKIFEKFSKFSGYNIGQLKATYTGCMLSSCIYVIYKNLTPVKYEKVVNIFVDGISLFYSFGEIDKRNMREIVEMNKNIIESNSDIEYVTAKLVENFYNYNCINVVEKEDIDLLTSIIETTIRSHQDVVKKNKIIY